MFVVAKMAAVYSKNVSARSQHILHKAVRHNADICRVPFSQQG